MKLSLNWLKSYVKLPEDLTLEKLAYDLTMRTVEVEGYEDLGAKYKNIVVGIIKSVSPHPDADKLKVCQVDVGNEVLQIVCGGENLYEGEKVVVSKIGAFVVWHGEGEPVEIKKTKMRGVKSEGMICAAEEVGLEELFPPKGGREIVDLGLTECCAGENISEVLGLTDWILDIDNKSLTNRPDCYCHYGMAREMSAFYHTELFDLPKIPKSMSIEGVAPLKIEIENPSACRRYVGVELKNIKIEPSPKWMQLALSSVGMRPINNVVDITNYVMLTVGNPTHAFDRRKVKEKIEVRFAKKGEKLTLLDDTVLSMNEHNLVIADAEKPLGLAGIMGGLNDSISPDTDSIIFEAANFDGIVVRKTLKEYDLRTEASIRFEKNIDTGRVDEALRLALHLFKEIIPTVEVVGFTDCYPTKTERSEIEVSLDFLNKRLGKTLCGEDLKRLLTPLGFELTENGENFDIKAPIWRSSGDIKIPEDILEETARMIGYDSFETKIPKVSLNPLINQRNFQTEREIKEYLAFSQGFMEVFTYPWAEDLYIKAAGLDDEISWRLASPPSPDCAGLRNSLVPGILKACVINDKHFSDFKIFETGKVFLKGEVSDSVWEEKLPREEKHLCAAIFGKDVEKLFFMMKGSVEGLNDLRIKKVSFKSQSKPAWADFDLWLNIFSEDKILGSIGALGAKGLNDIGIKNSNIVLLELNLSEIVPLPSRESEFTPLEIYPLVENDLAIVCDDSVSWEDIKNTVAPLVKDLMFLEEYRSEKLGVGKKSIVFRFWIAGESATLTQEEIEKKRTQLLNKLSGRFGAELRQ